MDVLNRQAEQMRAAAAIPEPLWMSVALTFGVGFVFLMLMLVWAIFG